MGYNLNSIVIFQYLSWHVVTFSRHPPHVSLLSPTMAVEVDTVSKQMFAPK